MHADRAADERATLMAQVYSPMSRREARTLLALFAKVHDVQPRIVQDETERARMQGLDKSGHQWKIGDEYIAVDDVRKAMKRR